MGKRVDRTRSALKFNQDEVEPAREYLQRHKKSAKRAPMTDTQLMRAVVDYVGKRVAADYAAMLDSGTVEFVPTQQIARRLSHRLKDKSRLRVELDAMKDSFGLSPESEATLDTLLEERRLDGQSRSIRDVAVSELERAGYRVVGEFTDKHGKRHHETVLPRE